MTEITGYTMDEINRQGWYQSLYPDPEYQKRARDRMNRMRTGEDLKGEEWHFTRSDGTKRVVSISTSCVLTRPDEVHILALIQDLTERKQAEEEKRRLEAQMQTAQKLESLGILAGGIAHDFNNLLTVILGHANLAIADLPPGLSVRDNIREIENASIRASELCKQMLAYAGKGRFSVESLNVSDIVQEIAHLLKIRFRRRCCCAVSWPMTCRTLQRTRHKSARSS